MKIIEYKELTTEIARKGCFVANMPNEAYHAYEGISKSGLDLIARSPAHYAHAAKREPTRHMVIGTAIHTALLEPERFESDYLLLRDVTDRRSSEYKQAIKVHNPELVLTGKEADHVSGMQESVYSNPCAAILLEAPGWYELSAFVECPVTGVLMRARYDKIIEGGVLVDLKKTQDIEYSAFQRSVGRYRYHVQDAFYSRVYELITGEKPKSFKFLCVEEQSPYASKIYSLDDEAKLVGARHALNDANVYADCNKRGEWPYPDGSEEVMSLPAWSLDDEDFEEVTL